MKNTDLHFKMLKFIALKDNIYKSSMPTHISVWGYMYPLVFPFGGTCSFLRVHIF